MIISDILETVVYSNLAINIFIATTL